MSNADDATPENEQIAESFNGVRRTIRVIKTPPTRQMPDLSGLTAGLKRQAEQMHAASATLLDIDPNETPVGRAANASERTAEMIEQMAALTANIVDLTEKSLKLSESARLDAARSEKFAKAMSWVSTVIAVASLATAIIAITAA